MTYGAPRHGCDFELIDDQVIQVLEAGHDQCLQTLCRQGAQLQVGFHAGGLGHLQNRHPAVGVILPRRIQRCVQTGKSKMKNLGCAF